MNQPLVSILVVTYNAERFIAATLKSCLSQTYTNTELLVFDNHSTDRTKAILQDFRDPRLTVVVSGQNLGPYEALNKLLDRAKGQFVAIQDHDDLWLPGKLERQIRWLEANPEAVACGTQTFYYYEDRQLLAVMPQPLFPDFVDHTSLVFRAGDWQYQPAHPVPDELFIRRTLRARGTLGCLPEALTIHRIRSDRDNLSSRRTRWNFKAGWAHFALTRYRDAAGMILFLVAAILPSSALWWIRRHLTMRKAQWLTVTAFEKSTGFKLT